MKNKLVKRLLLLFLFTSVFIGVSAQNHIKYTYDKAGNRIKKEIVLTRSAFSNDSDNIKPFTDIIRKTKCFDFWERNVLFPKTKRSFFRTPTLPFSA